MVGLPGAESAWKLIQAGVPQDSILDPPLLLLYINEIVSYIGFNIRHFAADTRLFIIENPDAAAELLNLDLEKVMTGEKLSLSLLTSRKQSLFNSY